MQYTIVDAQCFCYHSVIISKISLLYVLKHKCINVNFWLPICKTNFTLSFQSFVSLLLHFCLGFKFYFHKIENNAVCVFPTGFLTWGYPRLNILSPFLCRQVRKFKFSRFHWNPLWHNFALFLRAQGLGLYFRAVLYEFLIVIPGHWYNVKGYLLPFFQFFMILIALLGRLVMVLISHTAWKQGLSNWVSLLLRVI